MALINCPECGREISDKAEACVNCGFPIKKYLEETAMIDQQEAALIDDAPFYSEEDKEHESNYNDEEPLEYKNTAKEQDDSSVSKVDVIESISLSNPCNNSSTEETEKSKSHIWIIVALVVIGLFLWDYYPQWKADKVNSEEFSIEEIVGAWDFDGYKLHFSTDGFFTLSSCKYITGRWEKSGNDNNIRISYTVSDEQLEMFYQDWIEPYPEDFDYGYYPSVYDVTEAYVGSGEEGIPHEGIYHLIRTDKKLVWNEDDEYFLTRR